MADRLGNDDFQKMLDDFAGGTAEGADIVKQMLKHPHLKARPAAGERSELRGGAVS